MCALNRRIHTWSPPHTRTLATVVPLLTDLDFSELLSPFSFFSLVPCTTAHISVDDAHRTIFLSICTISHRTPPSYRQLPVIPLSSSTRTSINMRLYTISLLIHSRVYERKYRWLQSRRVLKSVQDAAARYPSTRSSHSNSITHNASSKSADIDCFSKKLDGQLDFYYAFQVCTYELPRESYRRRVRVITKRSALFAGW